MEQLSKYLENKNFIIWVFQPDEELEQWWKQFETNHPAEKRNILLARKVLLKFRTRNKELTEAEKIILFSKILKQVEEEQLSGKSRRLVFGLLRYAAVALVFTAIGGLLVYHNIGKEKSYQELTRQPIVIPSSAQGPLLITSNGNNVKLRKSNSTVDYSKKGSVVLNNDSVLQTPTDDSNTMNQLVIPYGNQSRVVLSDNTIVWLNAGSRLVYPTQFKDKSREVILFGEAYFEVSKNPKKPFVVKTSDLDIKVLGTKFNVSAYEEDKVILTVLKNGSVAIRHKGAKPFEKDIVIKPNQMASYDKTNSDTKIYEVAADAYSLWTKGLISFNEVDFSRVIKQLERFYNISIQFSDHQKEAMRISGKLDLKRSKKEVMEYLEKVSLSSFEQINESQYMIK